MIILCGIHVKIKLYYFLFYMVFNTTFLVFCNYSKSFIKYNNSRNLILTSTDKSCRITFVVRQAQLAQLVEQRTENPCVSGSIPELGIIQQIKYFLCGCSSMVEHQPSKLDTWVRFPSPAFLLPFFVCPQSIS